ncbi:MAG: helix-turn-helix transcriptional regulator [Sulfuriferula sp.]|nr:helix-turn-helix transcriptional regulator [Sulfuriferula sp.]
MYNTSAENDWISTLDAIYAAVGQPSLWSVALDAVCSSVNADTALLFTPCPQLLELPHYYSSQYDVVTVHDYLDNFLIDDPYNASAVSADFFKTGAIAVGQQLVPTHHLRGTRFYREFCVKHNQAYLLASVLFGTDNQLNLPAMVLSFYRAEQHGAFEQRESYILGCLLPHIQRAWLLHTQITHYKKLNADLSNVLNSLNHGVLIASPEGAMRFANDVAKCFLSNLYLSEIKGAVTNNNFNLPTYLIDCMNMSIDKLICRRVALRNSEEWVVVAACLKNLPHLNNEGDTDSILLWITKVKGDGEMKHALLTEFYKLTATESQILSYLLNAQSLQNIADSCGVKISTIRTHLKSLFLKTNTQRQQDLVRLAGIFNNIRS